MSDKRPYTKLTKEEEAVFDKYLTEFLNAGFRSPQRKEIVDRTYQEILKTNPHIQRNQVHNKYNNLLSNHKNKNKQNTPDDAKAQPPPPPPPPPPYINQAAAAAAVPPPSHMQLINTQQNPNSFMQQTLQYQMQQPIQRHDSPAFISRHDSLQMGGYPSFYGFSPDMSANNSQAPSRTTSNNFDNMSSLYFLSSNPDDFFNFSGTNSFISTTNPQPSIEISSITNDIPTKINNCSKDKLYSLLPSIQEETDFSSPDCAKELYRKIKDICISLYNAQFVFKYDEDYENKGIIFYDKDKLDFLQKAEESFIEITNLFTNKLNFETISPQCSCCDNITPPLKNLVTISRRNYNIYASPPEPSRMNSFPSKTSADLFKPKLETENSENANAETDKKELDPQRGQINTNQPVSISQYSKLITFRNFHLNDKLLSFFTGEFNEENLCSTQFNNAETFTLVSFSLDLSTNPIDGENQFLFCHPAYIYRTSKNCNNGEKCFMLFFNGIEIETGFFAPATSMYFYRDSGVNRIYACGDKRVKEYTIEGLDEYIKKVYNGNTHPLEWSKESDPNGEYFQKNVKISNTNTFYIGDGNYKSTAITVWKGQLVVGSDSFIHFWQIDGNSNTKMIDKKENIDEANTLGLDLSKVEWSRGKLHNDNVVELKEMPQITSLSVIEKSQVNSYLAVGSSHYPVVYVLNEDLQIVCRLISHTMGITSLKSFNFKLFSSSLDRTARIWNLNQDETMSFFDTQCVKISEIEVGVFFDQMFLFTGAEGSVTNGVNNSVQCWSVTNKRMLFEIELDRSIIPKKITFMSGRKQIKDDTGKIISDDFAKLVIVSERAELNGSKSFITQFFEFI